MTPPERLRAEMEAALPERILRRRTINPNGCWEWSGGNIKRYGVVWWEGADRLLHRVVAHLAYGLDLNNPRIKALHKCDNPPCFNPEHLYVGTQADNVRDMIYRGHWRAGGQYRDRCGYGHPMTGDNVWRYGKKRRCRQCTQRQGRARVLRRKAKRAMCAELGDQGGEG